MFTQVIVQSKYHYLLSEAMKNDKFTLI